MASMEEIVRKWYESLPFASLYSLKDFHSVFFQHYQNCKFSLSIMDSCCEISKNFIKFLENSYGDEECMEEDILESLYDFSSRQELTVSSLDETDWDQNRERHIPDIENENDQANVDFYKTQCSPLSEDETDQLLKNHVTTQVKVGL